MGFKYSNLFTASGCNTGIGKVTAMEIARRGAKLLMLCRDLDKAEATAKEIRFVSNSFNGTPQLKEAVTTITSELASR